MQRGTGRLANGVVSDSLRRLSLPKTQSGWIGLRDEQWWRAMFDFLRLFLHFFAAPFQTQAQLEVVVTLLRHQLNVLRRQAGGQRNRNLLGDATMPSQPMRPSTTLSTCNAI
jgi:hypothetical protein